MLLSLSFSFCVCSIHWYILKCTVRSSKQVSYLPVDISSMHNGRILTRDLLQHHISIFLQNGGLQIADHLWLVSSQFSLTLYHQFLVKKIPRFLSVIHPYKSSTVFLIFPVCVVEFIHICYNSTAMTL